MSHQRDVEMALDAWRAAERRAGTLPSGSPERDAADADVERLRSTYHDLVDHVVANPIVPFDPDPDERGEPAA
jgi:hypothetical protein